MGLQIFAWLFVVISINCKVVQAEQCNCLNDEPCEESNYYCRSGCKHGFYGPGCQIHNIGLNKVTWVSLSNIPSLRNPSDPAVDGKYDAQGQTNPNNSCTAIHRYAFAFWQVILGTNQSYVVLSVSVIGPPEPMSMGSEYQHFRILTGPGSNVYPTDDVWHLCFSQSVVLPYFSKFTCLQNSAPSRSLVIRPETRKADIYLCEVIINGYEHKECDEGFAGPMCLLRSCASAYCGIRGGVCGPYRGCSFTDRCPEESKLPPDCLITFSDFATFNWTTAAADNIITIKGTPTVPVNFLANATDLQFFTNGTQINFLGKYNYWFETDGALMVTMEPDLEVIYHVRLVSKLCFEEQVCPSLNDRCYNRSECFQGSSSKWLQVILTKADLDQPTSTSSAVNGTQCNLGFTGPDCLLRSCGQDYCEVYGGVCGTTGGCRFIERCPEADELPPDCWKRFSDFAKYNWNVNSIDGQLAITGNPNSPVDFAANLISVDAKANGIQINATGMYRYTISADGSVTLTMSTEPKTFYTVLLTPMLCFKEMDCIYDNHTCYNSSDCFQGRSSGWLSATEEITGTETVAKLPSTTLFADDEPGNSATNFSYPMLLLPLVVAASVIQRQELFMPSDTHKPY